ncbi:MAG TPA: CU044_5270 family protein [Solirubrobacterales bacterium]
MDELTLLQGFRAERAERAEADPTARAAAWRALEARFESASATAPPAVAPPRRRRLLPRHRRLFALAGATAVAAAVAGILVLGSGPTAQPAAAEVLHETAAVAVSPQGPAASPLPGPGQFAYRKFERLELQGWVPGGASSGGGLMRRPDAFNALMPTTQEWWTAADGAGRVREVAGTPRFLSSEEQARWEAAGSRLPAPFDPEYQRKYPLAYKDALELGRGVVDTEHAALARFHFPDNTDLPTEPAALREAIETHNMKGAEFDLSDPAPKRRDSKETIEGLFNILVEGPTTPQLRAAVFNALAELPGIEVDTDATDFLGRQGYAVRSIDRGEGGGIEFIFDPDTAELLAQREFLSAPGDSPYLEGLPAGQTIRETAYIEDAVVGSTHETGAEAGAG